MLTSHILNYINVLHYCKCCNKSYSRCPPFVRALRTDGIKVIVTWFLRGRTSEKCGNARNRDQVCNEQFFVLLFVLFLKFLSSVHKKNANVKYMSESGFHFSTSDEFTWVYGNHLQCGETCAEHAIFFSGQMITFLGIMPIFFQNYSGTFDITMSQRTDKMCSLYRGSFPYSLLLLGWRKSFVTPRTFVISRFYCIIGKL